MVFIMDVAHVKDLNNSVRNSLFFSSIAHLNWGELEFLNIHVITDNLIVASSFEDLVLVSLCFLQHLTCPITHSCDTKVLIRMDFLSKPGLTIPDRNALEISTKVLINNEIRSFIHDSSGF